MSSISKISSIFNDDVQHLHGNLFRVKRNKIKLAKSGISSKDGELVYGNPRWFINKEGELEAKGIEKMKMEELQNSIQDEGLENPIRVRVIEGKKENFLEIVNGERRFRCLSSICEKNLPCFDASSNEQKPANEIYEWIDCRIEFMDDKTALRVALKPNETSEIIGDLANLHVIKVLRESGFDDQEILKSTGKSLSWLRETEKLINLDDICKHHFENEKINRKVALELAAIENVEERVGLLEKIFESAQVRHSDKINQITKKKEKAEEHLEIEEASAHIAKKKGDESAVIEHEKKAKKAKKQIEATAKEEEKLKSQNPIATSKDLESVNGAKPLSHNKIQSIYLDLISHILEAEGYDEEGNSFGIDLQMLCSVCGVLQEIMNGNREAMDVLMEHCPLVIEEENSEESEEDSISEETEIDEISDHGDDEEEYEEEEEEEEEEEDENEEFIEDEYEETDPDLEAEFRAEARMMEEDE